MERLGSCSFLAPPAWKGHHTRQIVATNPLNLSRERQNEIVARLKDVCSIVVDDFNSPGIADQEMMADAQAMTDAVKGEFGVPTRALPFRVMNQNNGAKLELVPEIGMGVTLLGWTDRHPYEVVDIISGKCIQIRAMKAEGGLKKDHVFLPGGFCGHVVNQETAQEWTLSSDLHGKVIRLRRHKDNSWRDRDGQHFLLGKAIKFHDYNF